MRKLEKIEARRLRKQGKSIKEIERLIGVRRSSVSVWVRDISLTAAQKKRLAGRGHSLEVSEKRRQSRLSNETKVRMEFLHEGLRDIEVMREIDLFALGMGLYWGEGSKTNRGAIELSNTDPRIIQIYVMFLTKVCGFSMEKLHAHIGLHSHLSITKAEHYWSRISGIPLSQFQKTSIQHSISGRGERDHLPFGTFSVGVYDTAARLRLEGWTQGIYKKLFPSQSALHDLTKLRV
ncbi:hypothetical protein HZC00_02025 [Candidatus Kaiserbacteria bacterium]|nr:hypothetical protein [Candidatus Kaiserbacteria bacterium]